MNRFEQTSIWQKTLGKQLEPDAHEKERAFLRVEYENFRAKARLLAAEISITIPEFTVHDITHLDSLWETSELVIKDSFELTPAEAYVLGGAFLIHDLGMGLASFPKGIVELKKEIIWKDTIASILKEEIGRTATKEEINNVPHSVEKRAAVIVLRQLHAKHAEKLAIISWSGANGEEIFLIENAELRNAYGRVIGLIAHSHWWPVSDLENHLPKILGAPGIFPSSWTVDAVKMACVLRIGDAIQIDDRRAPSFLRALRRPSTNSDLHWNFQQKLYQPRLERNRLVFTSKSPFTIKEVESWWICHDTLEMIDNELKAVDSLLSDTNRQRLRAVGVASIEDPKRLAKLISVDGWQPVDAKVKVTDVAKLVISLGGKQLYGNNLNVPLRELIQNASDAIRARRLMENRGRDFGDVIVRLGIDASGRYIEVEDNGIGMSPKVLVGPFLDFGQSFWGSALMHEELPGLESKGFRATGKYGIGFFSVFMLGDRVTVASKRFEEGWDSTTVLEFDNGVSSRPIMRKANTNEIIKDGGTKVRIWLRDPNIMQVILTKYSAKETYEIPFSELIETMCPSIDCNVISEEEGISKRVIHADDWLTISGLAFFKRIIGNSAYKSLTKSEKSFFSILVKNNRVITEDDGTIVGRLLLYNRPYDHSHNLSLNGMVTVGGMRSSGLTGLIGILIGNSERASRDIGVPAVSKKNFIQWASDQAMQLSKANIEIETQIECAETIRACGGDTDDLKIAYCNNGALNYMQLRKFITEKDFDQYYVVQDASISLAEKYSQSKIEWLGNVIWVSVGVRAILQSGDYEPHFRWPFPEPEEEDWWFQTRSLEGLVMEAFAQVWGESVEDIAKRSDISTDEESFSAEIGSFGNGKMVTIEHLDVIKRR